MLGKLYKYDMKSMSRYLIPMHILMIAVSLVGRFLVTSAFYNPKSPLIFGTMIFTYVSVLVIVSVATSLVISIRFYKNLFTDEGYLTLTLPATPAQHLNSKMLAGITWFTIDLIIVLLSLVLLIVTPGNIENFHILDTAFREQLNMSAVLYTAYITGYAVLGILVSPLLLYLCVSVGQLFSNHKVLGAVVAYFVITTILQVAVISILVVSGALPLDFSLSGSLNVQINYSTFFGIGLKVSIACVIVEGGISYLLTHYILKNKTNLT